ncbi:PHD finger protein 12-like isoform X1 [Anguilla rostrata]|uniref:PHD finger protein 12-like isoform X1 n=1 Tax=Anguilla rostrata TaxID=7938 RepID=UPI0030CB2403
MWDKMETPAIVYDLDTSGGLMEQIQTLLAPPKSEEGDKRSRKPEKDARRSGRATNHDTCDSCREGGDLLCCDHCPAAFHLQCCDPPLSEEMLPPGEWMCHRCMVRRKKREQKEQIEQINGLLERQLSKQQQQQQQQQSSSPAAELELGSEGAGADGGPGAAGLRVAVAQVRLLERRAGSSRPGTPTSNTSTDTPTPSEQNDVDEDLLDVEDEAPGSEPEGPSQHLRRPFELLIAAAMERNPTQFQLPSDLTCTTALPGTSKRRRKEEMTGKNVKRPQHELDHNGLVPLPVKVCFSCNRSCRLAPLIQCDYCPLLFHMDCLNPPLAAMPTGKWMCPNHSEHLALNQRYLTLSNRCQLFDRFQDRMSQHAVKVDFLQRVHRQNPPNRRGAPAHRKALKVPDAIKSQYQCPPPTAAPAGIRDGELICSGVPDPLQQRLPPQHLTSEAEQQEWLRDVIALQCSIVRHLSAKQTPPSPYRGSEQAEKAGARPCAAAENSALCSSDRTALPEPFPSPCGAPAGPQGAPAHKSSGPPEERRGCGSCAERPCQNCGTANGLLEQPAKPGRPSLLGGAPEPCARAQAELQHRLSGPPGPHAAHPAPGPGLPNHTGGVAVKTEAAAAAAAPGPCAHSDPGLAPQPHRTSAAGGQAAALTSRSVSSPTAGTRALTPPRAPQDTGAARLGCPTPPSDGKGSLRAVSPCSGSVSSTSGELSPCLKALIEGEGEIELSKLDEKFIKLLAWQRIQQLFPPKAPPPPPPPPPPSHRVSPPPATPSPTPQAPHTQAQREEVQARAVFYPLMGKGGAVNMCYRSLNIGSGADMDVCLTNYGHCNYVSGKHACIFYDENTKHYELLNYSEHGTTVDSVLYSCDFSEKASPSPYSSMVSKVQNIIRRCKKRKQQEARAQTGEPPAGGVMSSQSQGHSLSPCGCKASSSSLVGGSGAGWEGTALLHHGSYIKLGCLQFVFSITEFASKQPKEETPVPAQEGAELSEKQQTLNVPQVPVLRSNSVP